MDFFEVLLNQRAHRALKPDPVDDMTIERLLVAATHAPSAENRQPWVFVVVRDPEVRRQIAGATRAAWEAGGREYSAQRVSPELLAEVEAWTADDLPNAPVHIVVCGDTTLVPAPLLASSIFPAVQNLLLSALALGLGSMLSTLPVHAGVARLLGLPDHIVPLALVPVGYPAKTLGKPRRLAPRIHFDHFQPDGSTSIS